jgi:hypothetical protein
MRTDGKMRIDGEMRILSDCILSDWQNRAFIAEDKVSMLESENDKLKRELALYKSASSYPRGE